MLYLFVPCINAVPQQSGSLSKVLNKKSKKDTLVKPKPGTLKNIMKKNATNQKSSSLKNKLKQKNNPKTTKPIQSASKESEETNTLYIIIGALALIVIVLMMRKGEKEAEKNTDLNNDGMEDEAGTSETEDDEETSFEIKEMENASLPENNQNIENTYSEETQSEMENELVSSKSNDEELDTHIGVESKDDHIPHKLKNDDGSVLIDNVKDFYKMTLNYEDLSLDHAIIIYYDGGKDFPNFDSDSDCNILKFNTIEDFIKWSDIPFNKPENISESKLYKTMLNSNRFWQIAEGELLLEWNGVELNSGGLLKVWPSEEMIAHPITKENSLKSEFLLSKNSVLPSFRRYFGNGVDWVVQYETDLKAKIKNLLIEKNMKITVSDIDTFLRHQDVDEIKKVCEEMYNNKKIDFAGNGRYYVNTGKEDSSLEESKTLEAEQVDVEKELEKLKGLLDKGLIEEDDYNAKKNELLCL